MTKANQKYVSILMAFALLLTLFTPHLASAYTKLGDASNPSLTIHKFKQEPSYFGYGGGYGQGSYNIEEEEPGPGFPGQNAEGEALEGVTFTLTQTHSFDPETNEWKEVSGVEPLTGITDEDGQVVFTNADGLELGRYEVQETDGPDHVILNKKVYSVDVPMTSEDGTTLNYDVHIYPKNEVIRKDVELNKKGEDDSALEGVTFNLYKETGSEEVELEAKGLTTDADGKITVEGLAAGTYYFQETNTIDGYAINTEKIYFEVTSDLVEDGEGEEVERSIVVWTPVNGFVDENGVVINYDKPEITKDVEGKGPNVDEDGNPIASDHSVDRDKEYVYNIGLTVPGDIEKYSKLGAWDTLDERLSFVSNGTITNGWDVKGTTKDNIEFTQDGQTLNWNVIDLTKLTPGENIVITFTAKINADAELKEGEVGIPNTAEIEFDNDNGQSNDPNNDPEEPPTPPVTVDPSEGGLKIIKVDKADNTIRLEGAEFKLTTDEAGEDIVDATGTIITVNGEAYTGLLEDLATNANGEILIEGLTPGTYYLHETKAPTYIDENGVEKPYRLLTSPEEITIANSTEVTEVEVENSKSGWDLPTTGGIGTILFTLVGLGLMGIAAFAFLRRKQTAA